jgi:Tol biopolymer transport system component
LIAATIGVADGSSAPAVDAAEPLMTPGAVILASVSAGGVHADAAVESASLSADGTIVAFETAAPFGDSAANGFTQVYVKDLVTGALIAASVDNAGHYGNGDSGDPSLNADGTVVVFESEATNLHDEDGDGTVDVYHKDLVTGEVTLVSTSSGTKGDADSENAVVSDDGTVVAFESIASNLVQPAFENPVPTQTYAKDLSSDDDEVLLLSKGENGQPGPGESKDPRIAGDGTTVVFETESLSPWPADQVVAADLTDNGALTLVSSTASGEVGSGRNPDVSSDGSLVVFQSSAANFPGATSPSYRIFLKELSSGELSLVSVGTNGPANGRSESPLLSDDGTVVAFESVASNLDGAFDDNDYDVFVRDLTTQTTALVTPQTGLSVDGFDLSGDGTVVAFRSTAAYDASDTDNLDDIYVKVMRQGFSTVTGTVTDAFSGSPIEGACVTLTGTSGDHGPSCTDGAGAYELTGVPRPADYDVLVDAPPGSDYLDGATIAQVARGTEILDLTLDADRDGNGVPDQSQDNMAVVASSLPGEYVTLAWPDGVAVDGVASVEATDPPAGYELPHGLVGFTATVGEGETITFTLFVPSTLGVSGYAKFQADSWSILPADRVAIFADRVEITLTDGGLGDADGVPNGEIVDPGGVVVADASQLIRELLDELDAMALEPGLRTSLSAPLRAALASLDRGQVWAACNTLRAFSNQVSAQSGKRVVSEEAEVLWQAAADARAAMRCA